MVRKTTELTDQQINSFKTIGSTMGSLGTLMMPGTYPIELKNCGINERESTRNQLLGCIATQPSGSQLVLEAVFFDRKDQRDNGDLHEINFESKRLISYYQGWGTWVDVYGDRHWENKACLRTGTSQIRSSQ